MDNSETQSADSKNRRICLEFANTVAWHASPRPEERLHTYAELVQWAQAQKILPRNTALQLIHDAALRPADAARTLKRAIELREAVYRIFAAVSHGRTPAEVDIHELNQMLQKVTAGAQISRIPDGYVWNWNTDPRALDSLLAPIALSAAELLVSGELDHVGQCADDRGCGWLFLDTSKNHSRRWCDVSDCGNRARQRRFQERARNPS